MKTCRQGETSCSSAASAVRLTRHCPDEPRDQFNHQVCSQIFCSPCLPLIFVLISFSFGVVGEYLMNYLLGILDQFTYNFVDSWLSRAAYFQGFGSNFVARQQK
jgi:hypothetical protein